MLERDDPAERSIKRQERMDGEECKNNSRAVTSVMKQRPIYHKGANTLFLHHSVLIFDWFLEESGGAGRVSGGSNDLGKKETHAPSPADPDVHFLCEDSA